MERVLTRGGTQHTCQHPWPEEAYLQYGNVGVVFGQDGSYLTAFFEAFPQDPATFIRGEGADVAAAETAAWEKYQRSQHCPGADGHEYERRGYRNGAGFCKHCNLFVSKAFPELPTTVEEREELEDAIGNLEGLTWREAYGRWKDADLTPARRAQLSWAFSEVSSSLPHQ